MAGTHTAAPILMNSHDFTGKIADRNSIVNTIERCADVFYNCHFIEVGFPLMTSNPPTCLPGGGGVFHPPFSKKQHLRTGGRSRRPAPDPPLVTSRPKAAGRRETPGRGPSVAQQSGLSAEGDVRRSGCPLITRDGRCSLCSHRSLQPACHEEAQTRSKLHLHTGSNNSVTLKLLPGY